MRPGLFVPLFDELTAPGRVAVLAAEAEQAGWDSVFVWDHVWWREPASRRPCYALIRRSRWRRRRGAEPVAVRRGFRPVSPGIAQNYVSRK